jgi:hypothetical protein
MAQKNQKQRLDESFSQRVFTKGLTGATGDHIDYGNLQVDSTGSVTTPAPTVPSTPSTTPQSPSNNQSGSSE